MPMRNDYPVLLDRTQEEGAFSLRRDLQPAQVLVEGDGELLDSAERCDSSRPWWDAELMYSCERLEYRCRELGDCAKHVQRACRHLKPKPPRDDPIMPGEDDHEESHHRLASGKGERRLSPSQQGVPLGGLLFTAVVAGLGSLANAHRHKVSEFVGNWKRKAIRLAEKCASATPAASFRQRCRFWEMCVTPAPPEETDERRQLVRATFTSNAWQGDSARAVEHAYDWCFRSVSSSQLLWRTKMAERLIQEGKVDTAWQRGEPREEVDASLTGWGDQGALALEETKAPNSTLEADDHAYWGLDDDTKECDEEDDLHAPVGEVKRYEDPTEDVSMDEHDAALPDSDRHNGNCSGVLVEEEEEEEDDAVLMSSPSRPRTLEGNEDEGAATVLTEATNEDASSSLKFPGASQSIDSALLSPSKHDRGRAESQAGKRGIYRSLSLESIDGVSFADSSLARDSPPYADRPLSRIPSQTDVDFNGHFQQTDGLQ